MNLLKPFLVICVGVGMSAAAWAEPPQAPKTANAEPATPRSAQLTSQAASAEMAGNPQAALDLAERAIKAQPRDPWGHYDKGMALARLGKTDDALKAFTDAEERFGLGDVWGRSVAIYGRAHALAQVSRCEEARQEFLRYAVFVRERDPKSADIATRYAADCRAPSEPARASTAP